LIATIEIKAFLKYDSNERRYFNLLKEAYINETELEKTITIIKKITNLRRRKFLLLW
jgi:hypothetical protein